MITLPWWRVPVGWWVCPSLPVGTWYRFDGWATSTRVMLGPMFWADVSPFEFVTAAPPELAALAQAFPGIEILEVS